MFYLINSLAIFLNSNFLILPVDVFGTRVYFFGTLNPAKVSLQKSINSFSDTSLSITFSMNAHGTSPHFSSDFATTALLKLRGVWLECFQSQLMKYFLHLK